MDHRNRNGFGISQTRCATVGHHHGEGVGIRALRLGGCPGKHAGRGDAGACRYRPVQGEGQDIGRDIRIGGCRCKGQQFPFIDLLIADGAKHRRVIDRADLDGNGSRITGRSPAVDSPVGEAIETVVVIIGGIAEAAVGIDTDGTMSGIGQRTGINLQSVSGITVSVISQQPSLFGDYQGNFFHGGVEIIQSLRRLIILLDIDSHRDRMAQFTPAVNYPVGKGVASEGIGIGAIGESAVLFYRCRTVSRIADRSRIDL